mgnify:CR=1 FL=1
MMVNMMIMIACGSSDDSEDDGSGNVRGGNVNRYDYQAVESVMMRMKSLKRKTSFCCGSALIKDLQKLLC